MARSLKAIGFSSDDCVASLRSYSVEIDEIISLFDDHGHIKTEKIPEAQTLLQNLKGCLKKDYDRRATDKGHEQMSEDEQAFFFPAIHEASTRIHVKTNSLPSQKWIDELLDAQHSIQYYLYRLEKPLRNAT
jgi:hypothetical protein